MSGEEPVGDWPMCREPDCMGAVVERDACFTHLTATVRHDAIVRAFADRSVLDLRGAIIPPNILAQLRAAATTWDDGGRAEIPAPIRFDCSTFVDGSDLSGLRFLEPVNFTRTMWTGDADFSRTIFECDVPFTFAVFDRFVDFRLAAFNGLTVFSKARFGVTFARLVSGSCAITKFGQARFSGKTYFDDTFFAGAADFPDCQFVEAITLGPMIVGGQFLSLSTSTVHGTCRVTASAPLVWLDHMRLKEGAHLQVELRRAEVSLQHTRLHADMYLSHWLGVNGQVRLSEYAVLERLGQADSSESSLPRPLALRGTAMDKLVLRDVDLRACRFTGARNLSSLTLEGERLLPHLNGRLQIADEIVWRRSASQMAAHGAASYNEIAMARRVADEDMHEDQGVKAELWDLRNALPVGRAPDVQAIYRTLRRLFEGAGDKPGADDFYYGEMEARRLTPKRNPGSPGWTTRILLWLYCGVSGYGLRASRAMAWYAVLLILGTVGLHRTTTMDLRGESLRATDPPAAAYPPPALRDAALDAFELSILPLSRTEPSLIYSTAGDLVRLGLVILGPTLLTLALIAFRARIKR